MKKSITLMTAVAVVFFAGAATASADNHEGGHSGTSVHNSNSGMVGNLVMSGANSGGNMADGSYAGDGGRGGDIQNRRGDDIERSSTGNGGRGGDSSFGGSIVSGRAESNALAMTAVNSNDTLIRGCACDDEEKTKVHNRNRGMVLNGVMSGADSGMNRAKGSYAGDGARGGNIRNSGDDVERSHTGNGGAGGHSWDGGSAISGPAVSNAASMTLLNSNMTRIVRAPRAI